MYGKHLLSEQCCLLAVLRVVFVVDLNRSAERAHSLGCQKSVLYLVANKPRKLGMKLQCFALKLGIHVNCFEQTSLFTLGHFGQHAIQLSGKN